jgi:hypothetical protein
MKVIMAVGEYLFGIVLGFIMFFWIILCMFAELPGIPRYLQLSNI